MKAIILGISLCLSCFNVFALSQCPFNNGIIQFTYTQHMESQPDVNHPVTAISQLPCIMPVKNYTVFSSQKLTTSSYFLGYGDPNIAIGTTDYSSFVYLFTGYTSSTITLMVLYAPYIDQATKYKKYNH